MEYLLENLDWFQEKIAGLLDQDYILFDCPGQLESSQLPRYPNLINGSANSRSSSSKS